MIPLRLHSDFSLLKAMVPVDRYCEVLKEMGYKAAAITDFNCAFGWVDFYTQMKGAGLKPILGTTLEISLAPQGKLKGHISLLVLSQQGFKNLCRILSSHSLQKLTIDRLLELQEGIALLVSPDHPQLNQAHDFFSKWNLENLYFEVHRYEGASDEAKAVQAAMALNAKIVATQPVYYLKEEDYLAHEVLLSIGEATTILDEKRPKLPSRDFYLKTPGQMEAIFSDHKEWCEETERLFSKVKFEWDTGTYHIPQFDGGDQREAFAKVNNVDKWLDLECEKGLVERLELVRTYVPAEKFAEVEKVYRDRLKEECEIIHRMRFSDYFLVVADFIQWSKNHNIPVGPGRGSGAGSLAAYCLKIVDIDPVRYTLLFERFLNPERVSMPDFDVDFCVKGRDQVIQYVRERYNLFSADTPVEETLKVAQIVTFGKMKSKAVIRDVGRALGIPYADVDAIAKLIPNVLNITLSEAYEKEPQFAVVRERDPKVDELLRIAERLEGMNRHASVHAAGVVIADDVLSNYVPLYQVGDNEIVTQFEMKGIEKIGLLKFDFLGLRNLTVIHECIQLTHKDIDLLKIDYSDSKVMAELSLGDTIGIFQLESSGMRDVIRKLKPTCLEDIIAIVALYRPGPLEGGMVDDFILRKAGRREVVFDDKVLEPILKETYGVFVYQEQVMKTANVMAGFSLGEADLLRRAMGKKKPEEMASQRIKFVEGAFKLGHSEQLAQKIFDLMSEFANYGFNKSHAAAYAMVTVQTAYLKTYCPEAFFAALLSSESDDLEKIGVIVRNATASSIAILPPHVNSSHVDFSLEQFEDKLGIRYGLSSIKNLGRNVAQAIVAEREKSGTFADYDSFFQRAPHDLLNKRQAECLIRSGSLDNLGATRSTLFNSLEGLLGHAISTGKARRGGQGSLFSAKPKLKVVDEWADRIRLNDEKHLLGTYVTGHPLDAYRALMSSFRSKPIAKVHEDNAPSRDTEVSIVGMITTMREIFTKKGTKMAFFAIEDLDAQIEIVMFPDLYEKKGNLLAIDRVVMVKGQVVQEGDGKKMLARDVSDVTQLQFSEMHVKMADKSQVSLLVAFSERARKYPGEIKVKVHIPVEGEIDGRALSQTHVTMDTPFHIQTHPEFIEWIENQFGLGSLSLR